MPKIVENGEDKRFGGWLNEEYSHKLKVIINAVEQLFVENKSEHGDLPYFTPHNELHCSNVENLIYRLIPGENHKKFLLKERFYLLAAAWLHDIGMLKTVFINVLPKLEPNPMTIRKYHHVATAQYIVENWTRLHIDQDDKELLAKLCFFHRKQEDLSECDENFCLGNVRYRLRLMAAYLRLADALDICSDRTPIQSYAICLAYNIPNESKLHWIKHRIISGVYLDDVNHKIYIQFKIPQKIDVYYQDEFLLKLVEEKLQSLTRLIMNDLRTELYTIINVLVRGNITYYLDIEPRYSQVMFDAQMLTDLREIIINYDIMMAPSASKLLNMILTIIANILGFSLQKEGTPKEINKSGELISDDQTKIDKIKEFLTTIKNDIFKSRPCHLGLMKLVKEIENKLSSNDTVKILNFVQERYKNHHSKRTKIRENSKCFFSKIGNHKQEYNVLLYGYSELAVKTLCGFRDALICERYNQINDTKIIYNSLLEEEVSKQFRIFICDGQPKTQLTENYYIYHDGSRYALYLYERNFKNIIIIPDIIAGSILKCSQIDFLIVGANGITDEVFRHSSGHLSLIKLVKAFNDGKDAKDQTKIILTSTSEKIDLSSGNTISDSDEVQREYTYNIEGFKMYNLPKPCGQNRRHIWLIKDKELVQQLSSTSILFANPREDQIEIKDIDYIILDTDDKYFTTETWSEYIGNTSNFSA